MTTTDIRPYPAGTPNTSHPRAIAHGETYTDDWTPYAPGGGWQGVRGTADCGHEYTNVLPAGRVSLGTGYAVDPSTNTSMCYPCADIRAASDRDSANDFTGYVSGDAEWITSWTGGRLARVIRAGRSRAGWHGSYVWYIQATDERGRSWYGRCGGPGMAIRMRATKNSRIDAAS